MLETALALNPDFDGTYTVLGEVYKRQGKTNEAIKMLRRCTEINPRNSEGLYSLAIILKDIGDTASAEKLYKRVLELGR